jgi:hypothetical protein
MISAEMTLQSWTHAPEVRRPSRSARFTQLSIS